MDLEHYSPDVFAEIRDRAGRSAREVVPYILDWLKPASVVSLGPALKQLASIRFIPAMFENKQLIGFPLILKNAYVPSPRVAYKVPDTTVGKSSGGCYV